MLTTLLRHHALSTPNVASSSAHASLQLPILSHFFSTKKSKVSKNKANKKTYTTTGPKEDSTKKTISVQADVTPPMTPISTPTPLDAMDSIPRPHFGSILTSALNNFPFKDAMRSIHQENLKFSFLQLEKFATEHAAGLVSMEFKPRDKLALLLPNSAEHLVMTLAAAKVGVTIVDIDPTISSAEEIAFILEDSKCRGLIYEPTLSGINYHKLMRQIMPELLHADNTNHTLRSKQFRHLAVVITTGVGQAAFPGVHQFRHTSVNSMDSRVLAKALAVVTEELPLVQAYEAARDGGLPTKHTLKSHADVLQEMRETHDSLNPTANDSVCLASRPLGISSALWACLERNAQIVLPSLAYDEQAVENANTLENCSILGSGLTFKRI